MRNLDISWQALPQTLLVIALVTLIGVGIRLLVMTTVQQRRERANRQINERLRVLIAAYKTLGGSFTGNLAVDPSHLRDLRLAQAGARAEALAAEAEGRPVPDARPGAERARQVRDAVEAALSDIILLGTAEHVRLAGRAAQDMAAGRPVHTGELVVSLRDFIRAALDLDPVPADAGIPMQGPTRPAAAGGRGAGGRGEGGGAGRGGGGMTGGLAGGGGIGVGAGPAAEDPAGDRRP